MTDAPSIDAWPEPPYRISDIRCSPTSAEPHDELLVDQRGRIQHVGPAGRIEAWGGPTVSGQGALLLPGFVDPHVHVRASASARASVDISDVQRTEDVLGLVGASSSTGEGWISVWGLQPELLTGKPLTATALDAVSGDRPVRIRHRSTHAWVFNTAGLQHLGLADLDGSSDIVVERGQEGRPTGHVVDHVGRVGDLIGTVTSRRELARHVRAWSRELAVEGIVAIVDATARNGQPELEQLAEWVTNGTLVQEVAAMGAANVTGAPPPVKFVGHKVMPPFGDDLQATLARSWQQGMTVAVHCVTVEELATVIEAVEAIPSDRRGGLRIEHASRTPEAWIQRIGQLGASIVTHPAFVHAHGDRYLADPELAPHEWLYRLRSWRDADVPLAFASDAPAGPSSPLLQIRSAVLRRTKGGAVLGGPEAMTTGAAVECLTRDAARVAGLTGMGFGDLSAGSPANAVLVQLGPDGLADETSQVLATVIAGRRMA